jgi:hypothetical protein
MLPINWTQFDMMNVTFQPMNMTPWELQEEFYRASKYFYDFKSARRIGKLFGSEYGRRRFGLAIYARLGTFGAHMASKVKGTTYYALRNTAWTGPFAEEESGGNENTTSA